MQCQFASQSLAGLGEGLRSLDLRLGDSDSGALLSDGGASGNLALAD